MEQDMIIKFCVVGEPSVGKTSMLYQYVHEKFDQKVRPTIGCDFSTKLNNNIDGKPVRLQLWDIAGQQRFNAVSKMYLRGALGCIIVCSAAQEGTLEQTLKWKKIIEENSDVPNRTIPCLLVQNKCDLIHDDQVEPYQTKKFLQDFAKQHGFCGSMQCSAKENKNIRQIFQTLLNKATELGFVASNQIGAKMTSKRGETKDPGSETIKLKPNQYSNKQPSNRCCK